MICKLETEHPLTDKACKEATGRTLKEWFAYLDAQGKQNEGRRNLVMFIYDDTGKQEWWAITIAVEYEKHCGRTKKDGLYDGYGICCTKTVAAPLADVYSAWVDNATLGKWFGAGTKAAVKEGGAYSNKDGDQGKYLRIRENRDLRFTWENPVFSSVTQVDVVLEDKGKGKTGIMVNHGRIQTRAEADGLRNGWGAALNQLKELLESKAATA